MTVAMQRLATAAQEQTDAFRAAIHTTGDIEAALATITPDGTVEDVPVGGPRSGDELRRHLAEDVLPHLPDDLSFRRVTRTVDVRTLVDQRIVGFTHDRELPWLLPGIAPTHRRVEVLAISVVAFRHRTQGTVIESLITSHRTLWDHTGLRTQLGVP
jgi:carboxymethylenebutenolidase